MTDSNFSQQDPEDSADDWLGRQFQIDQSLAHVRTIVQVVVMSVSGGGVGAPPTVGVKPLVKIVDGQNNATSHGVINNIQVSRVGCGSGSIIADPVVGDVGWLAVSDRDSSVVATTNGKESQPGSRRMFDLADGIYIGKLFGNAPTQFVQFTENGVNIKSGSGGINLNGVMIDTNGNINSPATITGATDVVAAGISGKSHLHSDVATGGAESGPPVA
jgi:hypothetical protein